MLNFNNMLVLLILKLIQQSGNYLNYKLIIGLTSREKPKSQYYHIVYSFIIN